MHAALSGLGGVMPVFTVQYADGHVFHVNAPDEASAIRHAEHPAVNRVDIHDLGKGGHGRAEVIPTPPTLPVPAEG